MVSLLTVLKMALRTTMTFCSSYFSGLRIVFPLRMWCDDDGTGGDARPPLGDFDLDRWRAMLVVENVPRWCWSGCPAVSMASNPCSWDVSSPTSSSPSISSSMTTFLIKSSSSALEGFLDDECLEDVPVPPLPTSSDASPPLCFLPQVCDDGDVDSNERKEILLSVSRSPCCLEEDMSCRASRKYVRVQRSPRTRRR